MNGWELGDTLTIAAAILASNDPHRVPSAYHVEIAGELMDAVGRKLRWDNAVASMPYQSVKLGGEGIPQF